MVSKAPASMIENGSDSDWESVGTPTPPESPPLPAQQTKRPTIKFDVPQHPRPAKVALTFVKARSDTINDSKIQQLTDDFEAFEASSETPRIDDEDESAAKFEVEAFKEAMQLEEARKAGPKSKAFPIHIETVNGDVTPEDEPLQVPANANDGAEKNDNGPQKDTEHSDLKDKILTCAISHFLAIMTAFAMFVMFKTVPLSAIRHPVMMLPPLILLGAEVWFIFDAGREMGSIAKQPEFRQKVAHMWQAVRDSLQDEDEEYEEEMTEDDKQLHQASQTIARSTLGLALVFLAMLIISPWCKVTISPPIEKFVLGVLGSIWIFALSRVDWKDTTMTRDLTTFIERWMPVQPVVDPNTAAQQSEQDLSLGLKVMQLSDEFVTFVLDMILKSILAATIGYIVLPVQTFGEVCGNRTFMSVSTVLMVKTPRLPLFEEAADGLLWAWDRVQPYVDRFTTAVRQRIARFSKYIIDNKQIWIANGKRFGKMAGDALLWTLNSAGRIVLASIFLHAVLLCLNGYQSRHSVAVQQENPIASGAPEVANFQAPQLERLNKWSDIMALSMQKVRTEHSDGRNQVIACPFGRGYSMGEKDHTDTDPEPHVEQEPTAEDPEQPRSKSWHVTLSKTR